MNSNARGIKMVYEFIDKTNIDQYITYLHNALSEEPDLLWVEKIDEAGIKARINDPFYQNTKSILAKDGDKVVGRIEYHFYGCLQDGYRMAYVDWVYVLPAYRHQGIAQQLFKEFEKDCVVHKIDQYYLIRSTETDADKFYHSFENVDLNNEPMMRKNLGDN